MIEDDLLDKAAPACELANLKKCSKKLISILLAYTAAPIFGRKIKKFRTVYTNRTFLAIVGMLESLFRFDRPG